MLVDISAMEDAQILKTAFLESSIIQRIVKLMESQIENEQIIFKCVQIIANITVDPAIKEASKFEILKLDILNTYTQIFDDNLELL